MKLAKYIAACTVVGLFATPLNAASIFNGKRGPTNFQLDERITYSKNNLGTNTTTNNLIIKYWDGKNNGVWGFLNLPYKILASQNHSVHGLGDVSVGAGPRGTLSNFHWFLYGSLNIPTGDSEGKITLGNGRYDKKIGSLGTYMISGDAFEIDTSTEYNFTGKKNGIDVTDEFSSGIIGGAKLNDKVRIATGIEYFGRSSGDYSLASRSNLRYTVSPRLHFELLGDHTIGADNIPRINSLGLFTRYNF